MRQRNEVDKRLPYGVKDLFLEDAARKTQAEETLRRVFTTWGYSEVIPPTFEYYESLAARTAPQVQEETYRFFDHEGRTLALRADLTIPTARIVATKLYDLPLPLRFYYVANVFRYQEPLGGQSREFTQAGIELVGVANPQADAEVIALCIEGLQRLGLGNFRVNLGHMGFIRQLFAALELSEGEKLGIWQAIDRKNTARLAEELAAYDANLAASQALRAVPQLFGGIGILDEAERLAPTLPAREVIGHLRSVLTLLQAYRVADYVILDLSEVRGMEYYTGITFEVFVEGFGFPVCGGGRYDNLIGHFGDPKPAVGFAITVERALAARDKLGPRPVPPAVHVVAQSCAHPECLALIRYGRDHAIRIEWDSLGRDEASLLAYAQARGINSVWICTGPGQRLALPQERPVTLEQIR
ncbi:MAG: ATP phosphoribosyltransferase regulatory subunit [Chloroflexi bacterium]|nr:ATP phosphoribosyltransferase regulatory subunit [Chloroflexota bacterium]